MIELAGGERRLVFDTRGRRKHVVRVVYAILALLMGASLFLVVGPVNIGSLLGSNSSTTSAAKVLNEQAERTEEKLLREPSNEALLLSLTRAKIAAGNASGETNSETGATIVNAEGLTDYVRAVETWDLYLKQAKSPNSSVAPLVAGTYIKLAETSRGLEEAEANIEKAAAAQRIAAEARPSPGSLSLLALYEYYAGDFAAGDKAASQTVAKSISKEEAKETKKQMAEYRARGKLFEKQKKELAKQEKERGKEALQNPLGGLGAGTGALGQ